MRYVALLGSINVGGNRLKMADLKAAMEKHGFSNVATVVASGNLLFDHADHADHADAALEARLAEIVGKEFGIKSFAVVRTRDEIMAAIDNNPFVGDSEAKFVHTVFLDHDLDRKSFDAFAQSYSGPERLQAGRREYYVDYAHGVGESKLDSAMSKAKLIKGRATARNVRSLARIADKMDQAVS